MEQIYRIILTLIGAISLHQSGVLCGKQEKKYISLGLGFIGYMMIVIARESY